MAEKKLRPWNKREEKIGSVVVKVMSVLNTWVYRLTGGRVGGTFVGGAPVLLLTTIGRRTGEPRTAPLLYLQDGEQLRDRRVEGRHVAPPALVSQPRERTPQVEVEIGREKKPHGGAPRRQGREGGAVAQAGGDVHGATTTTRRARSGIFRW